MKRWILQVNTRTHVSNATVSNIISMEFMELQNAMDEACLMTERVRDFSGLSIYCEDDSDE